MLPKKIKEAGSTRSISASFVTRAVPESILPNNASFSRRMSTPVVYSRVIESSSVASDSDLFRSSAAGKAHRESRRQRQSDPEIAPSSLKNVHDQLHEQVCPVEHQRSSSNISSQPNKQEDVSMHRL